MQSPFAPTTHKQKKLSHKKLCALLPTQYKGHSHCQKMQTQSTGLPPPPTVKQSRPVSTVTHSTPKTENHKQHVHAYMVSSVAGQRAHHNRHSAVQQYAAHPNRPKPGLRPIPKLLSNAAPRPCGSCKNRKNILHRWIGRVPKRLGEKP